jgi:hypothetical protein
MAPLRRLFNPLMRRIVTRTDVVFEDVLAGSPGLRVIDDQPVMAGGWIRMVTLEKITAQDLPDGSSSASSFSGRGQVSQTTPTSSATATATSNKNQINPFIAPRLLPGFADA